MANRRLILTADDFGAAPEVNEAVEIAHRDGVLTAASLMVGAPAAGDAVARAHQLPKLRVGLHIVLTDGRPVLPPDSVPDLVGSDGTFHGNMALAAARMFFSPKVRRQLHAEVAAQFALFRRTGLVLDHVNTHKHFHLHPTIASAILRAGAAFGLKAIRVPLERRDVLMRAEPGARPGRAIVTDPWARLARARFRTHGLTVPDAVFGLAWSGAMTAKRLSGLIEHLPGGLTEIYLHPATGPYPHSAPGYRYGEELNALCDPGVARTIRDGGVATGGFADS